MSLGNISGTTAGSYVTIATTTISYDFYIVLLIIGGLRYNGIFVSSSVSYSISLDSTRSIELRMRRSGNNLQMQAYREHEEFGASDIGAVSVERVWGIKD